MIENDIINKNQYFNCMDMRIGFRHVQVSDWQEDKIKIQGYVSYVG